MVSRVFIYGEFEENTELGPLRRHLSGDALATVAIEILREFSPLELIGKIYVLTQGRNYQPVSPLGVRNYTWHQEFQRTGFSKDKYYFRVKDGDLWEVLWIRQESDDSGPYIAVGLKHE